MFNFNPWEYFVDYSPVTASKTQTPQYSLFNTPLKLRKSWILDYSSKDKKQLLSDEKPSTDPIKNAKLLFIDLLGLSNEQASALLGNLYIESRFDTKAVGDGGKAFGIAQWHLPRQDDFAKYMPGKTLLNSSFEDLIGFVIWELQNTEKRALAKLKATTTLEEASNTVDKFYERSSGQARKERHNKSKEFVNL